MMLGWPEVVVPGVYQIPTLGAKVTVIDTAQGLTLVDAGLRGSWPLVAAGLRRLGLAHRPVCLAALTHYHPDHSGGLAQLARATGAPIAVHESEAPIIAGLAAPPSPFTSPLLTTVTRPWLGWLYSTPQPVAHLLTDGMPLPGDEPAQVIHTPGHTPGSICLFFPERQLLLVGDALQRRFRRLGPPALLVTGDPLLARASLRKLIGLDVATLCFGHFPPLRQDAAAALARLVERLERAEGRRFGQAGSSRLGSD